MSCFFDSQCRWRRTIKSAKINESANFPYAAVQRQGTALTHFYPRNAVLWPRLCLCMSQIGILRNDCTDRAGFGTEPSLHYVIKKIRVSQELRVATKLYLGAWEKIQDIGTVSVERE